jgi:uncharacterized RDD family membrane protein YckC
MDWRPSAVVTPEAVPLDLETASVGSRFLALLIDGAIQAAFLAALFLTIARLSLPSWVAASVGFFGVFAAIWGYPIVLETLWRGRTVGKAALGLRVVTREGGQIGFRHAAIRAALGLVDFILSGGAVAVVCVLATADNQRVGDLVAGTLVLRERTGMRRPAPAGFEPPPGLESYVASLDVAGLSQEDYGVARAFLLRAASLPSPVRARLAAQVAESVARRVQPPPPPGLPAEVFLACVATAFQRATRH